jgi:hypothetical protein
MDTGYFSIATSNNTGLNTSATGDLLIYTDYEHQRILIGCGSNTKPLLTVSSNEVNLCNLNVDVLCATNVSTNRITSSAPALTLVSETVNFQSSNKSRLLINSSGAIGIGYVNPLEKLHVRGNIRSLCGTVGPIIQLIPPLSYVDVNHNAYIALDNNVEPGNPGTSRNFISGLSMLGFDASGENADWSKARFIIRGVLMAGSNVPYSDITLMRYKNDMYSNVETFRVNNEGVDNGYMFIITPWFNFEFSDTHYALKHASEDSASKLRVGSVSIQFASTVDGV